MGGDEKLIIKLMWPNRENIVPYWISSSHISNIRDLGSGLYHAYEVWEKFDKIKVFR